MQEDKGWPDVDVDGEEPTCALCGAPIDETDGSHICADCARELREDAERDAATDKSDWPL